MCVPHPVYLLYFLLLVNHVLQREWDNGSFNWAAGLILYHLSPTQLDACDTREAQSCTEKVRMSYKSKQRGIVAESLFAKNIRSCCKIAFSPEIRGRIN